MHLKSTADPDILRAESLMTFLSPMGGDVRTFVIEGPPPSKARPRFRRDGKVYAKPEQVAAEQALGWFFKGQFPEPLLGNLAVVCIFFRANRQRIDVDNMLKHVMDSANKVCWADDSQVTAQLGIVEFDAKRTRTVVAIGRHVSTMDRGPQPVQHCIRCGTEFTSFQQRGKYCSRACASRGVTGEDLSIPRACAACGKPFTRAQATRIYCSNDCRYTVYRKRMREIAQKPGICHSCGKTLSKPKYGLCRDCWRSDPSLRKSAYQAGRLK